MKIAYFDCFSGISGDMCLGAVENAGVSSKELEKELKKIPVKGYRLVTKKVNRSHFVATKVDVIQDSTFKDHPSNIKRWKDIERIIHNSLLSEDIKKKGLDIFKRLFQTEAKVHGKTFGSVHLHELGAVDCIVDVFGTIIGLNLLGVEKVYSSPVNLGKGFVKTGTGILPVPAPATAEILKNVPVYSKSIPFELTTPTGAAIIKEISSSFGEIPHMDIEKIGTGAGNRDFKNWPNVLRIFVGNLSPHSARIRQKGYFGMSRAHSDETVTVIETNIDDMNPQIFEYVMERLYKAGALDVCLTNVIMKKGRPGIKLTVLCNEEHKDNLIKIVFKETSTIGLRFYDTKRSILQREIKIIETEFGKIKVKVSRLGNDILKTTPEYEDCRRIAKRSKIPLIEVMKRVK